MESPDLRPAPRGWKDRLTLAFASVLFLGYAPVASGTVGSLPGIGVAWLLNGRPITLLALVTVTFVLGTVAATRSEKILGGKDPGKVTIDEFVGMLIAFLWIPMDLQGAVIVFLLFRAFDIIKPFPARRCEHLQGGLGIMTDDVVAGIYANLAYRLIMFIF